MLTKKIFFLIIIINFNFVHAGVKINHWKTSEGSKVYFVKTEHLPILDITVSFKAGSARDNSLNNGVASLTNHLMLMGSNGINEVDLANKFSDIGAQLDSGFDRDKSSFSLRTLKDNQEKAIKLFNLVLHKPNFNKAIMDREKKKYIASIRQGETEPATIGSKAFMKTLYGNHPYGLPMSGNVETIKKITPSQLKEFYENYYLSNQASIVIVGDTDIKSAKDISSKISAGLPKNLKASFYTKVKKTEKKKINIPHPSAQAHLYFGKPIMKRGDPDFFPLYVGNYILGGGGFVSRLTTEVREKNGLVYSVYSYFMPFLENGPFQVGLQTSKDQIDQALNLVKVTVKDFIDKGPTNSELEAAKSNMIGGFPLRLESNKKIVEYLSMMAFYDYPVDYLDTFASKVNAVTVNQIKEAYKRRVNIDDFTTVIVGIE
tara:strand:+ start:1516 stop:2808 length:1293 start_codon:yes stop_codon:yes gene_type:complete